MSCINCSMVVSMAAKAGSDWLGGVHTTTGPILFSVVQPSAIFPVYLLNCSKASWDYNFVSFFSDHFSSLFCISF